MTDAMQQAISKLTLEEIEALAERLGSAARTIRDAQAMLGGQSPISNHFVPVGNAVASIGGAVVSAPHPQLDPQEVAERNRLLARMRSPAMSAADEAAASRLD